MSKQETDAADPYRDSTRNATLVRLAVEVMKANGKSLPSLTSAGGPDALKTFRAAMVHAETMLQTVENRGEEIIHAYRLFPCEPMSGSDPQNVREILRQFEDAGWGKGMSEGTLRSRIDEILRDIEEETNRRREGLLQFLERHGFKEPADRDIDRRVKAILEDFAIPGVIGEVGPLRSQMADVIRRMLDEAMAPTLLESGTAESPTDPLTIAHFLRFVCGHETCEEAKVARSGGALLLRPYELFLYAHQRNIQTENLTRSRKVLDPHFVPQPEYPSSLSIMVAHGGSEEYLRELAEEDEKRGRERETLEKPTEERLGSKQRAEMGKEHAAVEATGKALPGKHAAKESAPKKKSLKRHQR